MNKLYSVQNEKILCINSKKLENFVSKKIHFRQSHKLRFNRYFRTPKSNFFYLSVMLIFMMIAMINNSSALAVSPATNTVNFAPSLNKDISFSVVNPSSGDLNVVVTAQGEMAEYISIKEPSLSLKAGEKKDVSYTVNLPSELEPGLHTAEVIVLQLPPEGSTGETFIGAALALVTQLNVQVAYPGKYLDAEFNILGPDDKNEYAFVIPVHSRGEFDIVRAKASIDIFSSLNEKVATIESNEIALPSKSNEELVARWDAAVAPGPYRAVATIQYDEETKNIQKEFNIGERLLRLVEVKVNDFSLGEIAKFEMLVENGFGKKIEGVYSEMQVFNENGALLADFKSPTTDIESFDKTQLTAFWDTEGVREGVYDSTLFLKYGESSESQNLKLDIKDDSITIMGFGYVISTKGISENGNLVKILIGVIVFLVIANLSWFVFLRKHLKK